MENYAVNIYIDKIDYLIMFIVLHLAMTFLLEDESTDLLPCSVSATQSLEGQRLAAGMTSPNWFPKRFLACNLSLSKTQHQ